MGLFDSLKKIGESLGINFGDSAEEGPIKNVGETGTSAVKRGGLRFSKEIPEKYSEFPKFRDEVYHLSETKTSKYTRCTMNFTNVKDREIEDYIYKIQSLGYVKGSEVRFDKENTYIIVDYNSGKLNLVFHIKK